MKSSILKGGIVYEIVTLIFGREVVFRDTLPVIAMSLKNAALTYLPKDAENEKEIYPYGLYTMGMPEKVPMSMVLPFIQTEDIVEFEKRVVNTKCCEIGEDVTYFLPFSWAAHYCMRDCKVLAKIWGTFIKLYSGINVDGVHGVPPFSIDLLAYRTNAAIAASYMAEKIFNSDHDIWLANGPLRDLVQRSVVGGRCMIRDNLPCRVSSPATDLVEDFDAVSLYPSAISRLWASRGRPRIIKEIGDTSSFMKYFMHPEDTIAEGYSDGVLHITDLHTSKNRHFPVYSTKVDSIRQWCNFEEREGNLFVNAIDLWNLIEFQGATFEYDYMVVWDGERDLSIRNAINDLFQFRKENHGAGKEHPIQLVAKLLMNSCYGRTIMKIRDTEKVIVPGEREVDGVMMPYLSQYISRCGNTILSIQSYGSKNYLVRKNTSDTSSVPNIVGSDILAMARRIMCEVMCTAEDIEERDHLSPSIFYTDTDSMHIRHSLVESLAIEFKKRYGRDLIGDNLGQFHSDFDAPKGYLAVGAVESIFIAKKIYVDKLAILPKIGTYAPLKDDVYHIRMKGIPTALVKGWDDFEKLWNGEEITYDLAVGRPDFKKKCGIIFTITKDERTIGPYKTDKERKF